MATTTSTRQVRAFYHAADLPKDVMRALMQNESATHIVLSFAKKALNFPRGDKEQLWIVLYDDADHVEFVLSCTKGPLGYHPIFIVSSKSSDQIAQEEGRDGNLADSMLLLASRLLEEVPPQRVFSVFSIAQVTEKFAEIFEAEAHARQEYGIRAIKRPYYDATFTFCTSETLKKAPDSISSPPWAEDTVIALCRADMSLLDGTKVLCKAFSETSPPFVLDDAGAELDARIMIANEQVWVHVVQKAGQEPEIACLVAATRESDTVTAVSKVFTTEHWRGHGCAARLLHRVCQDILQKKKRIVLYVGNSDELAPARRVYHNIGFQGLNGPPGQQVKDVERWLEVGFEGTNLGQW